MREERVILGENCIYSTNCNETGINNNVLVCGGSGSGKTMSIAEPRLLQTKHSNLIATVAKRRLVKKYTSLFRKRRYKVLDLNLANPLESTCAYDPMYYVESISDITFLAKAIVKADPQKDKSNADPYWDQAAVSLLSAEIAYVRMKKKDATFADVLEFHDRLTIDDGYSFGAISSSLDGVFEDLDEKCFAVSCWKSFKSLPPKTAGCVYGTLNASIDTVFTPEIREMISKKPAIDFEQFAQKKSRLLSSSSNMPKNAPKACCRSRCMCCATTSPAEGVCWTFQSISAFSGKKESRSLCFSSQRASSSTCTDARTRLRLSTIVIRTFSSGAWI